ncbi:MAG: integration host factor subunit beta [Rhodobacteraceae bacterium]|nr:integration host factor subunit beta [Paracoccaceae bacterium]
MNRNDLIQEIQDRNPELLPNEVKRLVNAIFDEITQTLCEGNRIEIRGFGVFSARQRRAKVGRNPRTGESVHVAPKSVPFFKSGKLIRDRLNPES